MARTKSRKKSHGVQFKAGEGLNTFVVICMAFFGLILSFITKFDSVAEVKGYSTRALITDVEQDVFADIETKFNETLGQTSTNPSLVLVNLKNGEELRVNDQKVHVSASLYKLFTAFKTYENLQAGKLKPTSRVEECLDKSITISDNACGLYLGELLSWETIDKELATQGYNATILDNYLNGDLYGHKITTANDVTKLLQGLQKGELLNEEYSSQFLSRLIDQQINDRIPDELPEGLSFAHKTGNVDGRIHDAGFIIKDQQREYLYVIMSDGWSTDEEGVANLKKMLSFITSELY